MRTQWRELVGSYLGSASALVGVVLVMDARHPMTPLDLQLIEWLGERPLLALLSKADKLSRSAQSALLADVRRQLGRNSATLFSSVTRQGVEECRDLLEQWLDRPAEIKSPR
jgi:GTP-binding protein